MAAETAEASYLRLAFLCELEEIEHIRRLAATGIDLDWHPEGKPALLDDNVREGRVAIAGLLLELGARVDTVSLMEARTVPELEMLIAAGADFKTPDQDGWTLLHGYCSLGRQDHALCLLRHGADMNAQDRDGYTPLQVADELHAQMGEALRSFLQQGVLEAKTPPADAQRPNRRI